MSITSVNGTASSVQALLSAAGSGDSVSAIFSLSSSATDSGADTGLSDSDLANAFQMMSAAMQSALIASQGSGSVSTTDSPSVSSSALQPPPPPPPGSFDISATSASASGSDSTSDDIAASSGTRAATGSTGAEASDNASFQAMVAGLMAPPADGETAAVSAGATVSAVSTVSSGEDSGLDATTAALYADLDQLLTDLNASAATSATATGTTPPEPGSLDSILAKYQGGGGSVEPGGESGSFASLLMQDFTRAAGSYGQNGGSTSTGSISV